uniref:G-protein coupled receptors family 1 profile domain-containing protein n=1 Tax=Ditylenchus dipsaci TaxID=166011 RepID=A0A915E6U8_9BILA
MFFASIRYSSNNSKQTFALHTNLKVIFCGGSFFYVLHALCNFMLHFKYSVFYIFDLSNPCSYSMVTWECVLIRSPIVSSNVGFTFFHLVLFVERSCAFLYVKTYERLSTKAGGFAVFVMISSSWAYTFYLYYTEEFTVMKSFCNLNSIYNVNKTQFMNNFLLAIDVLVTLADFLLRKLIHWQKKR